MSSIYFSVSDYGWWIGLIILLSAAYSWLFYQSDRKKKNFSTVWLYTLMALRFLTVLMILVLLLKPGLELVKKTEEKPVLIFVQDRSESIALGFDSLASLLNYESTKDAILDELREDFVVYTMNLGSEIEQAQRDSTEYGSLSSNLSLVAEQLPYLYDGEQVAAVVFATDGIHNQGNQPEFAFDQFHFPLYTIGLGNPKVYPDLKINRLLANQYAFSGNTFPLRAEISAREVPPGTYRLSLYSNSELLEEKNVELNSPQDSKFVDFEVLAASPGLQKLKVEIQSLEEEKNKLNNLAQVIVEVLHKKQKVLLLAHSPHPDLSAMKQALESADQIEVDLKMKDQIPQDFSSYNLIILHQLPSQSDGIPAVLSAVNQLELPMILVLGQQSDLTKINQLGFGVLYAGTGQEKENAQVLLNEDFSLFQLDKKDFSTYSAYPPLSIPFPRLNKLPNQQVLYFARIKNVPTTYPLFAFYTAAERKLGIIGGEGIWQWRLYEYRNNGSHQVFNAMLNQMVQYMAVKLQKERLRVDIRTLYEEGESLLFRAELYNPAFEQVIGPDVSIVFTDDEGREYDYLFGQKDGNYFLNAGQLPAGNYSYRAEASLSNETLSKAGRFSILEKDLETADLHANHALLKQLSSENKGQFYLPSEFDKLTNELISNRKGKIILREEKSKTDLIELSTILFLLLLLFGFEWFSRKYHGAY